jgi:hypothetical protein
MAGPAELVPNQSPNGDLTKPFSPETKLSTLQVHAARHLGNGISAKRVAMAMVDHLAPGDGVTPRHKRVQRAYSRINYWKRDQAFRDAIYAAAVVQVDTRLPQVLNGITEKAIRGRVDAARLVLELTGRHNPKGEGHSPTVVVAIDGIARPEVRQIGDAEVVREG